jgi:hypothetical protein
MLAKIRPIWPAMFDGVDAMNNLIELREHEVQMVAGGGFVGNIVVQNNTNVNPQVAIGLAVLSPHSHVNANNNSFTIQWNVTASV